MGGYTRKDHTTARGICEALFCGRPGCPCIQAVNRGTGTTHCPAHDDETPSLSVDLSNDGKPLVHCNAGCTQDAVIDALRSRGLWPDRAAPAKRNTPRKIVAVYDYVDAEGKQLYQVVRYDPKSFAVRHGDGGQWVWKLDGITRVPYRLPELLAAIKAGVMVFVVEGEKDVEALRSRGRVGTTNPLGAGKWPAEFGRYFDGARVAVIPDNDAAGMKHAEIVLKSLDGHAASVVVVRLPDAVKDISEWFASGDGGVEKLNELIDGKTAFIPEPAAPVDGSALLKDLEDYFRTYAVLAPGVATTLSLWTMGTWVWDGVFDIYAYLGITSPVMRCGKSRVMRLLRPVSKNPITSAGISPAGLFRTIEAERPTLLIDEAQTLRRRDETNAGLYDLLCAGYEKGATVIRMGGPNKDQTLHFEVFCPKVFALIGRMDDTLADRSIIIPMRRRRKTETIKPFFAVKAAEITEPLKARLAAWVSTELKERIRQVYLKSGGEIMPPSGLDDREADLWFPLLSVARVADPGRVREIEGVALGLSTSKSTEGDALPLRMLSDLRQVWPAGQGFVSTTELLDLLLKIPDAPWKAYGRRETPLTGRGLAEMLRPFGIFVWRGRVEGYTPGTRGYHRRDLADTWAAYLDDLEPDPDGPDPLIIPQESVTSVTGVTNREKPVEPVASQLQPNIRHAVTLDMGDSRDGLAHGNVTDPETLANPEFVTEVTDVTDIRGVTGTDGQMDLEGARAWILGVSESFGFPAAEVYGWVMEGREQWERFAANADLRMIRAAADMFGWAEGQGTGY